MSRFALNTFLLITLTVSVALNWLGPPDLSRRNIEYFPNMGHSPRYNTFSPNPNFPDGKTLQGAVPGTIPRGTLPIHFELTPQDAVRAGEELHNPFPAADSHAPERGAKVFAAFCQPCHGTGGRGDGPVALRGVPAPPSLLGDHAMKMKDGQIFHVLTVGQGNMPSYRTEISADDRWKVVLRVRALQKQAAAEGQAPPPAQAQPQAKPATSLSGGS